MQVDDHADDEKKETDGKGDNVGFVRQIRVVDGIGETIGME